MAGVFAGLWAEGRGTIRTPRDGGMFFLPQQPFMPLGTLRQQLMFPSGVHMFTFLLITDVHGAMPCHCDQRSRETDAHREFLHQCLPTALT